MAYRIALGALCLALFAGCGATDYEASPGIDGDPVRVATYNIHHWVGNDGVVSVERLADVLDGLDADVVAVQEADNHLMEDGRGRQEAVEEWLGKRWVPIPSPSGDGVGLVRQGNALLIGDDVEVVDVQSFDISEEGRDPRAFVDAVLDVRGKRIRVVGAHLGLNRGERSRQLDTISAQLQRGTDADATVFMGDLNEWNPLARTFSQLKLHLSDIKTASTFPAGGPLFRLDRVWKSPGVMVENARVVRNDRTRDASDHLPVEATLTF